MGREIRSPEPGASGSATVSFPVVCPESPLLRDHQTESEYEPSYESARFERRQMVRALFSGRRVNDARLGIAMKEVFRRWDRIGRDPFGDKRDGFMLEVLDTYFLFTGISERLQGVVKGCRESEVPGAGATSLGFAAVGESSHRAGCWVEV
jgi:hypothetical protein